MGDVFHLLKKNDNFKNIVDKIEKKIALINCNVFDGESNQLKNGQTILIEGNKITAIDYGQKLPVPKGYFSFDANGRTVMPGLIDNHVHLCSPFTYDVNLNSIRQFKKQLLLNHLRTVYSGTTSVCDMGGPPGLIKEFQQHVSNQNIPGPRSQNCFTLLSPCKGNQRGYPTQVKPLGPVQAWLVEGQVATRPKNLRALREIVYKVRDHGGSHLKMTCQQHSFSAKKEDSKLPLFDDSWTKEIFQLARETGMLVSIHAPFVEGVKKCVDLAIEIGAQIRLQHVCCDADLDETTLQKMQDFGFYLIPTVMVYGGIQNLMDQEPLSGVEVLELDTVYFRQQFEFVRKNTQKAHAFGVIGFGTDIGGTYTGFFGRLLSEVQHYADFKISCLDILRYLTAVNAKISNLDDRGRLLPGKLADLIILEGDPLVDISALARISTVMKDGIFLKYDGVELTSI